MQQVSLIFSLKSFIAYICLVSNDDQEENTIRGIEAELKLEEGVKVDDSDDEIKQLQRKLQCKFSLYNCIGMFIKIVF